MTHGECGMRNAECGVKTRPLLALGLVLLAGVGCQQKMAQQPYYKPYEPETDGLFTDGRSNRPLEAGTVHRNQRLEFDPLVTGLTREEWARVWAANAAGPAGDGVTPKVAPPPTDAPTDEDRTKAFGAPRYDPPGYDPKANEADPHPGPKGGVYADAYPFPITKADLYRGEELFTTYCAVCHGPHGNGKGKIWERSLYKPTSYHTEKVEDAEPVFERGGKLYDADRGNDIRLGYSRGYWLWGIRVPVRQVPPGYVFEVITRGYGLMPDHAAQIKPADRWRIAAYVRVLQHSRRLAAGDLTDDLRKQLEKGDKHP